jgi:hypothetical protein
LASINNFKQRCALLDSAGVLPQDPTYGIKTACLPRSVVNALQAVCATPTPAQHESDETPAKGVRRALRSPSHTVTDEHLNDELRRVGSWGYKRAYVECNTWPELQILFPALQDRHHPSHCILLNHWKRRKDFSPLNYTEEALQFISEMDVCACHISPLDVKHNNRSGSANGFSLKQEAKLRSQEYLALRDVPDRVSPIKRSEGFDNPLAIHYCRMADDNMELLLQAQSQAYEAKLDSGVEDLCLVIAQLKEQAAAAAESFQAASHGQQAMLMAVSDASVAAKLDAESATQSALIEASKALDAVVHAAALAAIDAKDALAAAKESVLRAHLARYSVLTPLPRHSVLT